ncbi:MAG: DNA polymerase III subunit delta [Deltaproteobacteria bacterium]|nr:DNA polymerase III subunit delta [Deltaproteobacteria bacterium]
MTPADVQKDLASGILKPVYLIHGEEGLLKERLLESLAASVPKDVRDFNLHRFLAEETPVGKVLENAQTMPFLSDRRVIIIRGVDRYSADQLEIIQKYLTDPNQTTCLVLEADKPDFRLKFFKSLRDQKREITCQALKGAAVTSWVQENMAGRGLNISSEAARLLVEMIGTDLTELEGELEKIYLYAMDQPRVGTEEVKIVARLSPTATVFAMGDAVGRQQPDKALAALNDLLLTEHHLPIMIMLIRHFRLLLKARVCLDQRLEEGDTAKYLGVPPFAAKNYLNQARNLSFSNVKHGLARLLAANLTLVTSPAAPRLVLEQLVLDLTTLNAKSTLKTAKGHSPSY